jgi:thiol-disulfide isomerase/thioredoxin
MDQPVLTVFTAPGCCLCDDARVVLDRLAPELGLGVEWVDITGDPELEARWRCELPAGVLGGRKVFKYHVDEALLRRRVAGPGATAADASASDASGRGAATHGTE